MHLRRYPMVGMALAALVAAPSLAHAASSDVGQARIVSGSSAMPATEVARLVGAANYLQSAEARRSATSLHCYGKVYWKAGVSNIGTVIWKEWNHTAWCGWPGRRIKRGTVQGHVDTYTSVAWNSGDESWRRWRDPRHPRKARYTQGHAHFAECAGPVCVTSEDINTTMHIFANGAWRGR